MYAIALILIFILEIAAGIYAYINRDDVKEKLKEGLDKAVQTTYLEGTAADEAVRDAIDWFQETLECCGSNGPRDWLTSNWIKDTAKVGNRKFPDSCCVDKSDGCANKVVPPTHHT